MLLAGGVLAACAPVQEPGWQAGEPWMTPSPASLLPSPQATLNATEQAVEGLEPFLALSSVLTGFENLSPALGRIYLASLQQDPELGSGLEPLFEQAGMNGASPAQSIEDLESLGVFEDEAGRGLADRIIEMWYSGVVTQGEEQVVATFVDSLAWRSLTFTKPLTICGSFGFWAERPSGVF